MLQQRHDNHNNDGDHHHDRWWWWRWWSDDDDGVVQDVITGAWNGFRRAFLIMGTCAYVNVVRPIAIRLGCSNFVPEGKRPRVSNGQIQVAVVGFGRTGTVGCVSIVLTCRKRWDAWIAR